MSHTTGNLTYHYKVKIDLSDIIVKITEKIGHMDDGYCWEVDGDDLIITAKHTTSYEYWHYNATLESPEENTLELDDCVKDQVNVEKATINGLHEITHVNARLEIDEEDWYEINSSHV